MLEENVIYIEKAENYIHFIVKEGIVHQWCTCGSCKNNTLEKATTGSYYTTEYLKDRLSKKLIRPKEARPKVYIHGM